MDKAVGIFISLDTCPLRAGRNVFLFVLVAGLAACGNGDETDCSSEEDSRCAPTYCDVEPVIEDKCVRCHSDGGEVAVPFFLETYDEVTGESVAVRRAVETDFMPATSFDLSPPVQSLSDEEKDLILEWIDSGVETGGCD